ncbi:MAG: Bax inhibitor-1/YccA family protein, partial [Albidovulum sp.]
MAEYDTIRAGQAGGLTAAVDVGLRAHMNKVYGLMSVGMLLTALAAWAIAGLSVTTDPSAAAAQIGSGKYLTSLGATLYLSPLKWVVMFAPLAFVFGLSAMINKMSAATAQLVFYAFAAVMGISISSIFLVFTGYSIVQTFLITAIAFAGLSLWGYTTKKDISGWGSFLIMGVIGLLIASVVNIFLGSGIVQMAISALGVLIFAGLTAYDT